MANERETGGPAYWLKAVAFWKGMLLYSACYVAFGIGMTAWLVSDGDHVAVWVMAVLDVLILGLTVTSVLGYANAVRALHRFYPEAVAK